MPRAPRFNIAVIADLFRQLRFAPREVRLREMKAAEALLEDIEPERNYPQDFVTFRITGTRPAVRGDPVTLVGQATVGDLANLVQRLSEGLALASDHEGREAMAIEAVAGELNVSPKTVQRYRRQGLVFHYVRSENGEDRLVCFRDALERFVAGHRDKVGRAAAFTRTTDDLQRQIVAEARALRDAERVSLNEAALRLAKRHGRAHETIRNALRRHDRAPGPGETPIFGERGPLTERDMRLIHRAIARGISVATLAARFGKSPVTIRRARNRHRADRLRHLELTWVELPTFELEDAETVILAALPVHDDLDMLLPAADALALIAQAHEAAPIAEPLEHGLLAGYNALKRRAARAIAALPAWPGVQILDPIEADLRWAFRMKRRLVSLGLAPAVARIEQNIHRPLSDEPATRIVAMLRLGRDVVARTIETTDPSRGQYLERLLQYAMDRALAAPAAGAVEPATRAAARHVPGSVAIDDLYDGLVAWEWLNEP